MLTPSSPFPSNQMNINNDNRERKQRVVKNAHVDIEGVTSESGNNYCNWIQITKQKLKEREAKMINIKMKLIKSIFIDVK